ncbi:hypothetical protein AB0M46_45820 [Dactylosporangium sp. NPDC051485]
MFDWNDNEFDRHPRPVAPIFQPLAAVAAGLLVALRLGTGGRRRGRTA